MKFNLFQFIMEVFGYPLGYIMWAIYQIIHNYGWAIILFTIVTKALLIPFAIKQQKSTIKMQIIQPKMQEIQKKYKNNPQKMNEEIQALYERENYSMAAGCLPMLIQFPIIFGLLDVVYRPLTHLLHISGDTMSQLIQIATGIIGESATSGYAPQISILNSVKADPNAYAALGGDVVEKILTFDTNFLGLDLSVFPNKVIQFGFSGDALNSMLNPIILIPILSGVTALLMSLVTMRNTPNAGSANDFGHEAIEVILKNMEDHRKDLIVIVAGYTDRMEQFIHANPGLESRFNKYFFFEDYDGKQLMEIFRSMCKKNGYTLSEEGEQFMEKDLQELYEERDENFGNARDVRNLFEQAVARQADRVSQLEEPTREQLMELKPEDLEEESPAP